MVQNRRAEHWLKEQKEHFAVVIDLHFKVTFIFVNENNTVTVSATLQSYLCIQEDDSLLCDEEINACALVASPFLDFLSLGSEYITPVHTIKQLHKCVNT